MCGINGIFAYHSASSAPQETELLKTREAMRARGPDGSGAWWSTDRHCGLGHRRLSIIDLSDRASQPMASDDGARLEALARDAGVSERVRFLGAIGLQGLMYRMADVFVMPSTGEGFGIAFLEAMASGTPAIGRDTGGARDALADGDLGTLVPDAELPAALARLLAAPKPDPHALAAAVRARFGREIFVAGVSAAFNRLMETN